MRIVSFFSGAGGLDLGFKKAGFEFIWANEFDPTIHPTFKKNFPKTTLDTRSIVEIDPNEVPDCDGIIGGPPCQSWSEAGAGRGINDSRGQLFHNYVDIIEKKKPKFFLAENVSGLLFNKHNDALNKIFERFLEIGYNVSFKLLDANDYGVPQNRKRVIIVGYPASYGDHFFPPEPDEEKPVLRDAIAHLSNSAVPALSKNHPNPDTKVDNHEFMIGKFSTMYMSRNRVRSWDEPSFTIQAGGRHAPCHPQAPKMIKVEKDRMKFKHGSTKLYRRLTIRECAAIQTFPDEFKFEYKTVADGYKMIGNAVPVKFAEKLATKIMDDLKRFSNMPVEFDKKGSLLNLENSQMELKI